MTERLPVAEKTEETMLHALLREAGDLVSRLEALLHDTGPAEAEPATGPAPALDCLTRRENRVMELLLLGLSNRQIARRMVIAEPTVKNHLHSIFGKLGVADRTQAVAKVLRG